MARGVPVEADEGAEQSEDLGSEVLGFVEDEQDGEPSLGGKPSDLVLDVPQALCARDLGLQPQLEGDLVAEVAWADLGVMDVEGADLLGVKLVAQAAQGPQGRASRFTSYLFSAGYGGFSR